MSIKYAAVADGYVWSVTTSHGTVIAGEAFKRAPREWVAIVTHDDGEPVRTPMGGRTTGHADSRAYAVTRALSRHTNPAQAWLDMMNT